MRGEEMGGCLWVAIVGRDWSGGKRNWKLDGRGEDGEEGGGRRRGKEGAEEEEGRREGRRSCEEGLHNQQAAFFLHWELSHTNYGFQRQD